MEIDRDKIYQLVKYTFQNFTTLDADTIEKIRLWRNHPDIRKYMYNPNEITELEHQNFINSLKDRRDKSYWLVSRNDTPLGVINLVDIDYEVSMAELGYYLIQDYHKTGIVIEFLVTVHFFFFEMINISTIYGGTNIKNIDAQLLNKFLGGEEKGLFTKDNNQYLRHFITKEHFLALRHKTDNFRTFVTFLKETSH